MMIRWLSPIAAACAIAGMGCGPGSAAKAARSDMPTAEGALGGCVAPGDDPTPWVIDLQGTERSSMRNAFRDGIVLVRYDCEHPLKVLRDCKVRGGPPDYDYRGTPSDVDGITLDDSDSVRAAFSGGQAFAASLKAEFDSGTKLQIAYQTAGEANVSVPRVARGQLEGRNCD